MDLYCEQSVANANIDKHSKRTKTLGILRYVCITIVIILALLIFVMPIDEKKPGLSFLMGFIMLLLIMIPFIVTYILLGRMLVNSNLEFDYYLNGSTFRIVKVVNRKKRKKMVEVNTSVFESLGHISAEAYERYAGSKDVKKLFAITDYEDEDSVYYIYYSFNGTKYLLHIAPSNDMVMALRKSVARITILDKSFRVRETDGAEA